MKTFLALSLAVSLATAAHATTFTFKPVDAVAGDGNVNDLSDLDHGYAYTWGITSAALRTELLGAYQITSATLTIKNIYNWDKNDTNNQLYIHLLDNPALGVTAIVDDPTDTGINKGIVSDYFNGPIAGMNVVNGKWSTYGYNVTWATSSATLVTGNTLLNGVTTNSATNTYLTTYHDNDGPTTTTTLTYTFTGLLNTLDSYISDGHIGTYADFGLGFDPDCHFFNDGVQLTICTDIPPPKVPDTGVTAGLFGFAMAVLVCVRRRVRG
jgi:hypothetical protein